MIMEASERNLFADQIHYWLLENLGGRPMWKEEKNNGAVWTVDESNQTIKIDL